MKKDIVFLGIQGCGKGTQAKTFLEKNPEYKYFEAGNIFRALTSNKNIFSDYISSRINSGHLVEDKLVFGLFDAGIDLLSENDFVLLDGFPRDLTQKDFFEQQRKERGREFVCVNFILSREKATERIQKRALEQGREDDANIEAINERLDTFEHETLPVIQSFESEGNVIDINADQSIEEIYAELIKKLDL